MKCCILPLIALLGLISCTPENDTVSDKTTLLTSINWIVPSDKNETVHMEGVWSFKDDGTYLEDFDKEQNVEKIIMAGTWKWISKNEVSVLYKSMMVNGVKYDLGTDEGDRYILRITELSKNNLKVIKRHNGDAEDSGFAKKVEYIASAI